MDAEWKRWGLGGQQPARRAADGGAHVAASPRAGVWPPQPYLDRLVDQREGQSGEVETGDDAGLPRDQPGGGADIRWHDGVGGNVAGAVETPQEGRADQRFDHDPWEGSRGHPMRGHSASIRSTARRAGAARAGSMVTSWRISSSARRMLPRLIRFMCGQRLQGRTKAMLGWCTATLSLIEHSVSSMTRGGRRSAT